RVWNANFRVMQHNSNAAFRQAALNLTGATKLGGMIDQGDKFITGINEINRAYQNLVKKMEDKGQAHLIPKGASRFDQWAADIARYLEPNDPGLVLIKGQWAPVVIGLFDRGWADEKGVRAMAAWQPQLRPAEQIPPPEAWNKTIDYMRKQVQRSALNRYR